jgi:hypothetical protein
MSRRRPRNLPVTLTILAILLAVAWWQDRNGGTPDPEGRSPAAGSTRTAPPSDGRDDTGRIAQAFADGQSDLWVTAGGRVTRLLADDEEGSRHQRFIVELANGRTVLVSHNIDLAPRLDALQAGDRIRFHGEYEWNAQGGVIHWTHHDPRGRRDGGWLEHEGRRYD